jgi:hypothetical protein
LNPEPETDQFRYLIKKGVFYEAGTNKEYFGSWGWHHGAWNRPEFSYGRVSRVAV